MSQAPGVGDKTAEPSVGGAGRAPGIGRPPKVVLLGMMSKMPVAGVVWQNIHYLLGFERLGCEAYYVETHARTPSMLMSSAQDDGTALAAEFIAAIMRRFGFGDRWAFRALHADGRCLGMSERRLNALYGEADVIVNLHGGTQPLPELTATGRLVYLETDPTQLQVELSNDVQQTIEFLEPHCAFFTYAENWARPGSDCGLPWVGIQDRFPFIPTRPPVVMELWPDRSGKPGKLFTTIGNWRQSWRDLVFEGERYTWSKHEEFVKYLDLPRRTGRAFELALSSCEPAARRMLSEHGWRVRDGLGVSHAIDAYRDYIGDSHAEFTVAKDQNVRLRTGWFSDRSATYLASGRPVVTQDTGFGCALPTGRGLFAFDSLDAAADAVAQVDGDYATHAAAARALACERFAHDVVLAPILEQLGVRTAAGRAAAGPTAAGRSLARPASVFSPDLLLQPLSRRPTKLHPQSEREAKRHPQPPHAESPAMGKGSTSIVVVTYDGLAFTRLCLESVLCNTEGDFELIVVDNGSTDGTVEYLAALAQANARVRTLINGRNLGFPVACNQGLALARGEHLVLLNNDTMTPPGWLPRMLAHLRNPGVGLVGPVTNRIGNEAEVETDYATWGQFLAFARQRAEQYPGAWLEIATPAMFCLAMRADTHARLGPLDERYEVGTLEDDDYAARAREAGYQLRCVEDVVVHHFGEASFGKLAGEGEHTRILCANRRRYAEKWQREWEPYARRANPRYERESLQLRQTVRAAVPDGATVLVISRGDDALLELAGRRAMHFPQGRDGGWSGHHPASSEEAIGQLEALRRDGADYLVVPPTYRWWLSHYEGLAAHLEASCVAVEHDLAGAAIYRLQGAER